MKKKILLLITCLFLTGCTKINNLTMEEIVDKTINNNTNLNNEYRTGYKYYLPRGLSINSQNDYNEKINSSRYIYYLYVDVVSYYNNVKNDYQINQNAYFSKKLNNGDKFGYLEINQVNGKYLVEIMYNYAKIEVIVYGVDLNNAIANSITILNSIKYNRNIIENNFGENVLHSKEQQMNIFNTKSKESNYLKYEEIYGQYNGNETHDSDLID